MAGAGAGGGSSGHTGPLCAARPAAETQHPSRGPPVVPAPGSARRAAARLHGSCRHRPSRGQAVTAHLPVSGPPEHNTRVQRGSIYVGAGGVLPYGSRLCPVETMTLSTRE